MRIETLEGYCTKPFTDFFQRQKRLYKYYMRLTWSGCIENIPQRHPPMRPWSQYVEHRKDWGKYGFLHSGNIFLSCKIAVSLQICLNGLTNSSWSQMDSHLNKTAYMSIIFNVEIKRGKIVLDIWNLHIWSHKFEYYPSIGAVWIKG